MATMARFPPERILILSYLSRITWKGTDENIGIQDNPNHALSLDLSSLAARLASLIVS
jgi:hypothetical protein